MSSRSLELKRIEKLKKSAYKSKDNKELINLSLYAADLYIANGEFENAKEQLTESIQISESFRKFSDLLPSIYRKLSDCLIEMGDFNESIEFCEKSLKSIEDTDIVDDK
ncbi:MAG: hypothetical protein MHPSP_002285, partial [Paramarteilia canceri]